MDQWVLFKEVHVAVGHSLSRASSFLTNDLHFVKHVLLSWDHRLGEEGSCFALWVGAQVLVFLGVVVLLVAGRANVELTGFATKPIKHGICTHLAVKCVSGELLRELRVSENLLLALVIDTDLNKAPALEVFFLLFLGYFFPKHLLSVYLKSYN